MATPRSHPRPKRLRAPSDEEMKRLTALHQYARAHAVLKEAGVLAFMLPRGVRVRKPAPKSEQEKHDVVMERVDRIIEERVQARLEAVGALYTDDRPYHWWSERDRVRAEARKAKAAANARAAHDREVPHDAPDPAA